MPAPSKKIINITGYSVLALFLYLSLLLPEYILFKHIGTQYIDYRTVAILKRKLTNITNSNFMSAKIGLDLVEDYNNIKEKEGADEVYPYVSIGSTYSQKENVFLSGFSNKQQLLCAETGEAVINYNDRFGFRNDDNIYNKLEDKKTNPIIFLGDSYTQGVCSDDTYITKIIQEKIHNLIFNLGLGGTDPLTQAQILAFMIDAIKPKKIIWIIYDNDITEINRTKNHREYFPFSHNDIMSDLYQKKAVAIRNSYLSSTHNKRLAEFITQQNENRMKSEIWQILRLKLIKRLLRYSIKSLFNQHGTHQKYHDASLTEKHVFSEATDEIFHLSKRYDSNLIIIRVPSYFNAKKNTYTDKSAVQDIILNKIDEHGFGVMHHLSFPKDEIDTMHNFPGESHPSNKGYLHLSQQILNIIEDPAIKSSTK